MHQEHERFSIHGPTHQPGSQVDGVLVRKEGPKLRAAAPCTPCVRMCKLSDVVARRLTDPQAACPGVMFGLDCYGCGVSLWHGPNTHTAACTPIDSYAWPFECVSLVQVGLSYVLNSWDALIARQWSS